MVYRYTILHKVQTGYDELGVSLIADTCYVTLLLSASYTYLIPNILTLTLTQDITTIIVYSEAGANVC